MICLYTGTPGSGKSYEAVVVIVENLKKKNRVIYTNMDGMEDESKRQYMRNLCGLTQVEFDDLFFTFPTIEIERKGKKVNVADPAILKEFWDHVPDGCLVIFDEVHRVFHGKDHLQPHVRAFADWASVHRKDGVDVIMITQISGNLNPGVRSLAEWNYTFRKINYFGPAVKNKYSCNAYAGDQTSGKPISSKTKSYDSRIFPCYKSFSHDDIKEQSFQNHVNVLKHPIFILIPFMVLLSGFLFFKAYKNRSSDSPGVLSPSVASASPVPEYSPDSKKLDLQSVVINEIQAVIEYGPSRRLNSYSYTKNGVEYIKILYEGFSYDLIDFPFEVTRKGHDYYCRFPLS